MENRWNAKKNANAKERKRIYLAGSDDNINQIIYGRFSFHDKITQWVATFLRKFSAAIPFEVSF